VLLRTGSSYLHFAELDLTQGAVEFVERIFEVNTGIEVIEQ
jgi:hypothetical protein